MGGKDIKIDELIDALDSVTWYNGLAEYIREWTEGKHLCANVCDDIVLNTDDYSKLDERTRAQIEVIWMICVCLFGDYGTSPRSGWIDRENEQHFHNFITAITATEYDD